MLLLKIFILGEWVMENTKVIVKVLGGVVVGVYSNVKGAEASVLNFDTMSDWPSAQYQLKELVESDKSGYVSIY